MNQKGLTQLFVVVGVLIVIISGGVYLYSRPKVDNLNLSPQLLPQKQANLNEYSSQALEFAFEYTNELTVKEDTEDEFNKRGNGNYRKNFTSYIEYEPGEFLGAVVVLDEDEEYDTNPLTLWVFENPDDLTIDEWYKNYWYYPFVWGDFSSRSDLVAPVNEATISGQMVKSGVVDYQSGKPKFVYIAKDKKVYLFRIIGEAGEQILSTFKFL